MDTNFHMIDKLLDNGLVEGNLLYIKRYSISTNPHSIGMFRISHPDSRNYYDALRVLKDGYIYYDIVVKYGAKFKLKKFDGGIK